MEQSLHGGNRTEVRPRERRMAQSVWLTRVAGRDPSLHTHSFSPRGYLGLTLQRVAPLSTLMSKGGEPNFAHTPVTSHPLHPQQTLLIDIVCTSSLDYICTASLSPPKSTSPKAVQKPLPKWLNLHTDTVWQPNYMLMLHTRYILAGNTLTWKVTLQINFSTWCLQFSYVSFL